VGGTIKSNHGGKGADQRKKQIEAKGKRKNRGFGCWMDYRLKRKGPKEEGRDKRGEDT